MNSSDLQILFEDKYLLAINKPHGLVTDKDARLPQTLESLTLEYIQSKEKYPQKCFIGLPHRLDRPVSGVVLFAKMKSVLKLLSELFAQRAIEKTYLAITEHRPSKQEDELKNWIEKDLKQRKALIHLREKTNSLQAILRYKLISNKPVGSLLEIKLLTGKFHQIRAQLANSGCPIIGDTLYGASTFYKENGIALQARELRFAHPITKEPLTIIAPSPEDELWDNFKTAL